MSGSAPPSLRVACSTADAASLADAVAARYDFGGIAECRLLNRGFNDMFALRMADGARYVARLSGQRLRGPADVAAETDFLRYLDTAGVPVAAAMPARTGALWTDLAAPEGGRALVIFRHAEGRVPDLDAREDAAAHGVTLARLHDAAEFYRPATPGRYRLDLDHLLHRPLAAIRALPHLPAATRDDLHGLAARLSAAVAAHDGLSQTRCHGDCHGLNARILPDGPHRSRAIFFDFDDGGFGYLAYDLAVHLWAQVSFGRRRHAMWHAFVEGYRSVRPIAPADFAAVPIFVAIRHIWLMGEMAGQIAAWGTDNLSAPWLALQAAFLLAWERERLGPGLF
jgi:Ser/Thr protein kinase RdoA (MazF antagonist)